jgi:hypothetical protein
VEVTVAVFVLNFNSVIFAITIAPLIVYTAIAFAILSPWDSTSLWLASATGFPASTGKGEACLKKSSHESK